MRIRMQLLYSIGWSFSMDRGTQSNERGPHLFYARHVVLLKDSTGRPARYLAYVFHRHSPKEGI